VHVDSLETLNTNFAGIFNIPTVACYTHFPAYTLKVGSRQSLKNWMDVRREFYLQKKNVLATTFVCTMHQFLENLNYKISGDGRQ